jgi:hypothetical protein
MDLAAKRELKGRRKAVEAVFSRIGGDRGGRSGYTIDEKQKRHHPTCGHSQPYHVSVLHTVDATSCSAALLYRIPKPLPFRVIYRRIAIVDQPSLNNLGTLRLKSAEIVVAEESQEQPLPIKALAILANAFPQPGR